MNGQGKVRPLHDVGLNDEVAQVMALASSRAEVVGHPGSVKLMVWLSRAPEDRTPECIGFEALHDDSGFRYRWTA